MELWGTNHLDYCVISTPTMSFITPFGMVCTPHFYSVYVYIYIYIYIYAKQKHLGCKKVQGQSEATLQTGRHDQKV